MPRSQLLGRTLGVLALLAVCGCGDDGSSTPSTSTAAALSSGHATTAPALVTSASQAGSPATPPAPASRWWSGDFHVHTEHSGDGVDSVTQTANLARLLGMDFLAITDHSTLTQRGDPGFVSAPDMALVGGYEWTDMVHMGLIGGRTVRPRLSGPPGDWPAYVQALIDEVHTEGGAAILYHPAWNHFPWLFEVQRFDAVEVWNNLWTLSDTGLHPSTLTDVQDRLKDEGLAAAGVSASPEIRAALTAPGGGNDRALAYWEATLARGDRVAAVGGSDRHKLLPPGYPTTWVRAPSRSEAHIVAAVRAGRTIVTQGPEGPHVDFEADGDGDGAFEATIGDDVPSGAAVTLRVRVRGAQDGRVRIYRRGQVVLQEPIGTSDHTASLQVTPAPGDWFRVEVDLRVDWSLPAANPMANIAANPASGNVQALLSLWGVTLNTGTNAPAIALDRELRKLANLRLDDLNWARGAITSPIYVR